MEKVLDCVYGQIGVLIKYINLAHQHVSEHPAQKVRSEKSFSEIFLKTLYLFTNFH